jgi:hypothetical protein
MWIKIGSLIGLILLFFSACSDDVNIPIPEPTKKVVIDGWIESGDYPKVILTFNSPFFSTVDSASFRNMLLLSAKVTVSCGADSEVLTLFKDESYFPPYIYEGTELTGVEGKSYSLKVEYGGRVFTAVTTIPKVVHLDSLWYKLEQGSDTLGYIWAKFKDDPEVVNYYRIFTKRSGKDKNYVPLYISTYRDDAFNGLEFSLPFYRGLQSYTNRKDDIYFSLGDTVYVKFSSIDKESYNFWIDFEREMLNTGNPFASENSNVRSNIKGDGLGIWGGYGVSYYKIVDKP